MTNPLELEAPPMATRPRRRLRAVPPTGSSAPTTAAGEAPTPDQRVRFDDLYRSEWSGIVALGWTLTGSWTTAEELAQDAFADAYRRWNEVDGYDKPGAWIRRAVINRAASVHRQRASELRGLARWSSEATTRHDGPDTDRTGDRALDEVGDPVFWAAVRSLPERQGACVALHYLDDLSVADIADVLGCRASTVKVHLHRGRQALAGWLAATPEPGGSATRPSEPVGTRVRPTTDPGEETR